MVVMVSPPQVSGLQGQLAALREVSEGHHRRAEDLNNKLKQVTSDSKGAAVCACVCVVCPCSVFGLCVPAV